MHDSYAVSYNAKIPDTFLTLFNYYQDNDFLHIQNLSESDETLAILACGSKECVVDLTYDSNLCIDQKVISLFVWAQYWSAFHI